jgi:hypothetical protein
MASNAYIDADSDRAKERVGRLENPSTNNDKTT